MNILKKIKKAMPFFLLNLIYKMKLLKYKKMTTEQVFREIKVKNKWGSQESASGYGSEIRSTENLIMELPNLFRMNGIRSILDIPCGDFNWMKKIDLSAFDYIGGDIVKELISENSERYSSNNIKFVTLNIISDVLPPMDLIFVRDCFVHLSYSDIHCAIANIKKSGCKYLMATTFEKTRVNYDIITGGWRPINLLDKPFNFPEPVYILAENCTEGNGKYKDKSMGLWLIEDLPKSVS